MTEIDDIIAEISPYYREKKRKKDRGLDIDIPSAEHQLSYNTPTEALEQFYFWILDFMNDLFGGKVEKLVDNFASSPGSGHFMELQDRINRMQQQATTTMQTVNAVLRTVLNIIYDLKEFQIRLSHYDAANSTDKSEAEAGILALKSIWMDKVDIQRGGGSINAMSTGNLQFVTLRNAFMAADSAKSIDKLDLNDLVKRVLKPRVQEFFEWKKHSEQQLRKQFEIEKSYLKSQVNSLKLYSRWAKPYLKAVSQLTQDPKLGDKADLVSIFNNTFLQLTLMGKSSYDVRQAVISKDVPKDFKKIKRLRTYNSVVFVDLNFRGIPGKSQYGERLFTGKMDVTFKAYVLNDDEIRLLEEKLGESDIADSLKLVQNMTDESLEQIKLDLDEFLGDKDEKQKQKNKEENINPFTALFSFMKPEKKDKTTKEDKNFEKIKQKGIPKDKYPELYIRKLAEAKAINKCYTVFDVYKKAHGMASIPSASDAEAEPPRTKAEEIFGFSKTNIPEEDAGY